MKRTVAALALSASSTVAMAFPAPVQLRKTVCLKSYSDQNGVQRATACDEAQNNASLQRPLLANGCADGQTALTATKSRGATEFYPLFYPCMSPNAVQL